MVVCRCSFRTVNQTKAVRSSARRRYSVCSASSSESTSVEGVVFEVRRCFWINRAIRSAPLVGCVASCEVSDAEPDNEETADGRDAEA